MKRLVLRICVVTVLSFPAAASADGKGKLFNDGQGVARGVQVSAQTYFPGQSTRASTGGADQGREWTSKPGSPVLVFATNRCTATNLGSGFSYSFANGVECASFSAPSPDEPVRRNRKRPATPSAEQIAAALFDRAISLAPDPELEVAPSRIGLTGLRSFFWLATPPRPIVATATAGGTAVTAVAAPAEFLWDFGDGGTRSTQGAGKAWRPHRTGSIGHMYQTAGRYDLSVEILWQARWRVGTGPWQALGTFSTADSRPYPVREIIAWLVRQR